MTSGMASLRRPAVFAAAAALVISLIGAALVLMFSGQQPQKDSALKPIPPSSPAPATTPSTEAQAEGLPSGLPDLGSPDALSGATPGGLQDQPVSAPSVSSAPAALPVLQLPAPPQLPPLPQLPPPPELPAPPDWSALLQQYVAAQNNANAANIAGSITGGTVGAAGAAVNSAAVLIGGAALSQQLSSPDFTGLSAAFAAMADAPPVPGLSPPQLPPPPQLLPPPPQLPAPDQLAALAALPFVFPALPPPPPIGLPAPPSLPLPSITRLFGLPF